MANSSTKILVIERSPSRRRMLINQVQKAGYSDVEGVSTPQSGVKRCEETPFSLVITGWNQKFRSFLSARSVQAGAAFGKTPLMLIGHGKWGQQKPIVAA